MKQSICDKCKASITNNNFGKHYDSCTGQPPQARAKSTCCKHCQLTWKSLNVYTRSDIMNHSRWCKSNPKRKEYEEFLSRCRIEYKRPEALEKRSHAIKKAYADGRYTHVDRRTPKLGKKHKPESIQKIRIAALKSDHRRLRKNTIEYKGVLLDSTWEYALAVRLDEIGIKWSRPSPLKWIDKDGLEHNYFPDFYLEDYDLYLDPKNPAAYINQLDKIEILESTYPNIRFLHSLDECKNFSLP